MKAQTARNKSRSFAIRIVNMARYLREEKNEFILSAQVLKSGTSSGANLAEAECAMTKKDFLSKTYIALKEASETVYWLDILHETSYITNEQYSSMSTECEEKKDAFRSYQNGFGNHKALKKEIRAGEGGHSTLHSSLSTLNYGAYNYGT